MVIVLILISLFTVVIIGKFGTMIEVTSLSIGAVKSSKELVKSSDVRGLS